MKSLVDINLQARYFDQKSNRYNSYLLFKTPLHTKLEIQKILSLLNKGKNQGNKVADFGSGNGRLTIPLLLSGFYVTAIDISRNSLKELTKICQENKLKKIKTAISFNNLKKFDYIVGSDILHHIDIESFIKLFQNKLKKGGKLVFSEPGAWNPSWYIYLTLFRNWSVEKGVVECSYFKLRDKLLVCGYKNVKIVGYGFIPRPFLNWSRRLCAWNDMLGNLPLVKYFAYRYIIEAEKV